MSSRNVTVYGSPENFAKDMRTLISETEFSDITFIVGEAKEKVHAHRVILAGRCEVFRAMFAEQKQQERKNKGVPGRKGEDNVPLVLPDVRLSVFLTVLEFIYSNSCQLNSAGVVDVLASAIEYGLEGLAKCCTDFITANLNVETACEAMQAAITYNQSELRDTCLVFIEQNTQGVFKSRSFVEMSEETLSFILESDELQIDEKDILAAVKEWGTVNSVVAGKSVAQVIENVILNVRFPLLDESTLTKIEKENESANMFPVKSIAKAWKFHATKKGDPEDKQFQRRAGTRT